MVDRYRIGHTCSETAFIGNTTLQKSLGEYEDDVGQIQDLLNSLTIQAHFGGQNNKIIKLLGNHDVIITSETSAGSSYRQQYTSPYAAPAYDLFYDGLSQADKALYSDSYDNYVKFEIAHKLISGNTHVICKIGKWVFVHGGMNTYVLDALRTNCITDPAIAPADYIAHVNQQFHAFLQGQRTMADVAANAANQCLTYVATDSKTSLLINRNSGNAGDSYSPFRVWKTIYTCAVTEPALGELLNNVGGPGNHLVVAHCVQNQNDYRLSIGEIYFMISVAHHGLRLAMPTA